MCSSSGIINKVCGRSDLVNAFTKNNSSSAVLSSVDEFEYACAAWKRNAHTRLFNFV